MLSNRAIRAIGNKTDQQLNGNERNNQTQEHEAVALAEA
jgi:hypothetical protein